MFKLLSGWALLSTSVFVALCTTYNNQTPLLVGCGMLLLGCALLDTEGQGTKHRKKKEAGDGQITTVEEG